MRPWVLLCITLVACRRVPPAPAPVIADAGTLAVEASPLVAVDAGVTIDPVPPLPVPPRKLKLVSLGENAQGDIACKVVDAVTGEVVGRANSHETAAGGIFMACVGFELEGRVIIFSNTRGHFAKDARPGKTNNRGLPCGIGAWASDLSSCLELDTSPLAYGGSGKDEEDRPFHLHMCNLALPYLENCLFILAVPRGLNREPESPRPWDGAYCDDHTAVVVANGEVRLFAAPGGKLLARQPTPRAMTRVGCTDGVVTVTGGTVTGGKAHATATATARFRVDGKTLAKLD